MPEKRLYAKLIATSTITDLVGTRIKPARARQGDTLPRITYQTITDTSVNHGAGATDTNYCTIQIDCYASTYTGVKALAGAVKTALKSWVDNTGSPKVSSCHYQNGNEFPADVDDGQDAGIHRVSQDYLLWYNG